MMNYHDMTTLAQWKGQEAAERLWRAGRETPIVVDKHLPRRTGPTQAPAERMMTADTLTN